MMTTEENYFFDTYALVEIVKGNPAYASYRDKNMTLTKLNLFELYHAILKDFGIEKANIALNTYLPFVSDYTSSIIESAAQLKFLNRRERLSMTDCIGYVLARALQIKFLTGDQQFAKRTNVEYVK